MFCLFTYLTPNTIVMLDLSTAVYNSKRAKLLMHCTIKLALTGQCVLHISTSYPSHTVILTSLCCLMCLKAV